jgi:hypothetical protein
MQIINITVTTITSNKNNSHFLARIYLPSSHFIPLHFMLLHFFIFTTPTLRLTYYFPNPFPKITKFTGDFLKHRQITPQ